MMRISNKYQSVLDVLLIGALSVLLFFLVNPLHLWMPTQLQMAILGFFVPFFGLFIALFWREQPQDEREEAHSAFSGKVAFFTGTSTLAIAIVYQSLHHAIDWWVAFALIVMITSKFVARMFARKRM